MSWAAEELKTANLGDIRRNRRLVTIVEDLSAQPNASVTQEKRDNAALQGIYEFWANRRVKASSILAAHRDSTLERVAGEKIVLAVQDTTELNFGKHTKKQGLGSLSSPDAKGLFVHSVFCVSSLGVPLGVLHQKVWARKKIRRTSGYADRMRAISEKESQRWLEGLKLTQEWIEQPVQVVTVADREADIYELFASPRREGAEFLIRAHQGRGVKYSSTDIDIDGLHEARCHPGETVEGVLSKPEWQVLYCYIHQTQVPPLVPPLLVDCVRWIAQLGGFLGRKSDGEPGVKTLWLGLQRLEDMAAIWQLKSFPEDEL
ncbi:MAG: IS4 family transposase [Symploca sp. SIO2D2]|nr:IS4 family transposase [Symploca sp. SIO2D2]